MGAKAGLSLKFLQWFIRGVQLGCAALILSVYSYFLATLDNHNLHIATTLRAVEGISGIAVVYTLAALLLLCCLAGRTFSSLISIILDVAFIGAFIYVAIANKNGAGTCSGYLDTPYGRGNSGDHTNDGSDGFTHLPSYRTACRLQTACFAVSLIAVFFFIFSILAELALVRHHRKEKRFGPSPDNNYTSGYGAKKRGGFFSRFGRKKHATSPANNNALPTHTTPADLNGNDHHAYANNRESYNTENTAIGDHHDHHKKEHGYGYAHDNANAELGNQQPPRVYGSQTAAQPPRRYDDGVY